MQTGIIKKWEHGAGWGFIECDDGEDYFFNVAQVRQGQKMRVGLRVKFDSYEGQRGPEAENVSIV
tara:strand:+ start:331 stop:525 length:195 start_codon:yes stop_codon:yes gene_type:complete